MAEDETRKLKEISDYDLLRQQQGRALMIDDLLEQIDHAPTAVRNN